MKTKKPLNQPIRRLVVGAFALSALHPAHAVEISSGGTQSVLEVGYDDDTVPGNTSDFRSKGGKLFIHPNGWSGAGATNDTQRAAIVSLFPAPPIIESTAGGGSGASAYGFYNTFVKAWYSTLDTVCINNLESLPTAETTAARNAYAARCSAIAVIASANGYPDSYLSSNPFSSSAFNLLRANILAAGGVATDAPPQYYFDRGAPYRQWTADLLGWAYANEVRTICLIYARDTGWFYDDTRSYVADLIARGARVTDWTPHQYDSNRDSNPFTPLGDEKRASSGNYTALRLAEFEEGFPVSSATTNSTDSNRNPQYLIDGDLTGNYGSIDRIGQYYQFDFGQDRPVSGVGLAFYLGDQRNHTFTVQTSTNGTTWTNRRTNAVSSGNSAGLEDFYFPEVTARYLRIVNGGNSANNLLALHEARSLGWHPDQPFFKGLTASAPNAQSGFPASNLVDEDGLFTTRCSVGNINDYMQIDLGTTRTVKGVTVAVYNGVTRRQRFDVQVSTDGTDFTTVLSDVQTNGATKWNEDFLFSVARSARYVRFVNRGNNDTTAPNAMALTRAGAWGATVAPVPLAVTINTPAEGATFVQGNNLTVNASATGGTISNLKLSVNGVLMHQENIAPYDWSATSDAELGDLAAGLYDLSVTATANDGNTGTATRQIAVGLADGSGLALTELSPLVERFSVRATAPGSYTVRAAGTDLWGTADQGGIVTMPVAGDAVAVVKVESLADIDPFSKAGLIFRDSVDPAAANVALVVTASNGLRFQIRPTSGAASTSTAVTGISAPVWLRLSRQGNVFTAAYSTNGTTWTSAGTKTANLAATAPAGLAVTSHDDTQSTTATFSDLRLESANSLPGWRALIFSPADLSNPAISGDDADPDNDSLTNFHEFITDLNPHLDDRSLNRVQGTKDDLPSFRLQFRQRKDLGGVTRVFQHSSNLTDWPSVSPTSIELLQDLGNAATYEASFPFVGEAAFFRVRYEP
ncbi:discoidin domain-containing protein [Luteolibacter arcticus]|uniref:Discoidin domain-containing protein n=1 Tax=Luteolibacter arcticus TaxID=1581411 RepID=A0ABT3GQC1_9BACT|nr:discoidin domain-containing protein [Luteolibacter arcticus]MCW1925720.1 discoidin domain-containing protein [Luteolibacter arcticus]